MQLQLLPILNNIFILFFGFYFLAPYPLAQSMKAIIAYNGDQICNSKYSMMFSLNPNQLQRLKKISKYYALGPGTKSKWECQIFGDPAKFLVDPA
jgi:hypothetical protein